jgi:hypothetical protein
MRGRFVSSGGALLAALFFAAGASAAVNYILWVGFHEPADLAAFGPSGDSNDTARVVDGRVRIDLDRWEDEVPWRTELVAKKLPAETFVSGKLARIGREYWYGIKILVPTSWRADNSYEVVTQWHGADGPGYVSLRMDSAAGGAGLHGANEIADRWILTVAGKRYNLGPVSASVGHVQDWVFRIRWAPDTRGRVTVWRDKRWLTGVNGANMADEASGPYWKFGIYKSPWKQKPKLKPLQSHRTLYFDSVRIASGSGIAIDNL